MPRLCPTWLASRSTAWARSRYIRPAVDLSFYLTEKESATMAENLHDAVTYAFELLQTRIAMRARR